MISYLMIMNSEKHFNNWLIGNVMTSDYTQEREMCLAETILRKRFVCENNWDFPIIQSGI